MALWSPLGQHVWEILNRNVLLSLKQCTIYWHVHIYCRILILIYLYVHFILLHSVGSQRWMSSAFSSWWATAVGFVQLGPRDLVHCMLVCRRLFRIASDASLCKCLSLPELVHTCICTMWLVWYFVGKCIQLQKCSDICDEHLMWMMKRTPTRVVLQNCKGTPSPSGIQQFFRSVASTLKVSLNNTLFVRSNRLALVAQSVSAFGC